MSRATPALLIVALCGSAAVRADDSRANAIAPFVDDEVVAVLHLDLKQVDLNDLLTRLIQDRDAAKEAEVLDAWSKGLRGPAQEELYLLVRPADLPGLPPAIVPLSKGADARAIGDILCGKGKPRSPSWPTCATIHDAVFAGTPEALKRVRDLKPVARPELAAAFGAAGDTAVQILIVPGGDHRRIAEEMQPNLPRELGGGPVTVITRGMTWAAIALETRQKPMIHLVVQSPDPDAAQGLLRLGREGMKLFERSSRGNNQVAEIVKALAQVRPRVVGDRIELDVALEPATALVSVPIRTAREVARRSQCVNNLMQIGLAMHNYLSDHKTFPPAYSRDKSGRPLLSWRVHILPYLEQETLYKEFRLDEPWDSPHNRPLIDKIPQVYRCPDMGREPADLGKTTYLTPRGKATIFPGAQGFKINEITDGTSNTILVVDAGDDLAVTWTRPDDWEVEPELRTKGLYGHHSGGTNFGFADGSVRFLKETIKLEILKALLTRNGGEVLGRDDF